MSGYSYSKAKAKNHATISQTLFNTLDIPVYRNDTSLMRRHEILDALKDTLPKPKVKPKAVSPFRVGRLADDFLDDDD